MFDARSELPSSWAAWLATESLELLSERSRSEPVGSGGVVEATAGSRPLRPWIRRMCVGRVAPTARCCVAAVCAWPALGMRFVALPVAAAGRGLPAADSGTATPVRPRPRVARDSFAPLRACSRSNGGATTS